MDHSDSQSPGISRGNLQCFILRCWTNSDGTQRFRLINANTGQENLFQDIEQLTKSLNTILQNNINSI